jgi:hypothetical protein
MRISINGDDVKFNISQKPTLGEIVDEAEKFATGHGKVITQVTVNEEIITADEEVMRRRQCCADSDCVELLMDSPQNIIVSALKEAREDIPGIAESLRKVATHLQTGARKGAFSLFSEVIEQWKQVINLFRIAESALCVDSNEMSIEGKSLGQIQTELLDFLSAARTSMQEDDAITLSDLLEYELAPRVEEHEKMIDHLIKLAGKTLKQ